jgi:hypothetical protein
MARDLGRRRLESRAHRQSEVRSEDAGQNGSGLLAARDWRIPAAIVCHDRFDELFVLLLVRSHLRQFLDPSQCFAPKDRRVLGDLDLTDSLDVRHATVERDNELTERGCDAGR